MSSQIIDHNNFLIAITKQKKIIGFFSTLFNLKRIKQIPCGFANISNKKYITFFFFLVLMFCESTRDWLYSFISNRI